MGKHPVFTIDDARILRKQGFLVTSLHDPSFVRDRARIIFDGLKIIRRENALREMLLRDRPDNKDKFGRLVQGYFEKPADKMTQLNFVSYADGRFNDYIESAPPHVNLRPIFAAFDELNACARRIVDSLVRAIDDLTIREMDGKPDRELISVSKCISDPETKTITSATTYLARSGTVNTSPRPNTAASAIYWLAEDNPGMRVMNLHGDWADLSAIETNPSKAIIIHGKELSLVTRRRILESMHPIYPQTEDAMRSTLRTFVYISRRIIEPLEDNQEKSIDALLL